MNIGFIGLGNMGGGMARNMLAYCEANRHRLFVFDIERSAVDRLVELGAKPCQSATELAAQVEVLFTSLPGAEQINQLASGEHGILQHLPDNAVWFETSTNELSAWRNLVAQSGDRVTLVDAPVTGGAEGAAAATLTMLLGVDEAVLERHRELLASITDNAIRMGRCGAGYVTKLCQLHLNYLVAQGIGEALMLGAKAEINLSLLYEVLQNSCAQSYVVDRYIPMLLDGSYDPSFALGLAARDMDLISELGRQLDVELHLGEAVHETYRQARRAYGADAPHLSVVRLLEERSGRLLRD